MNANQAPTGNGKPVDGKASDTSAAWPAHAVELADWALERFFVRRCRYGGYSSSGGTLTLPSSGASPRAVNERLLLRHFRATRTEHVIGAHHLTPSNGQSFGRTAAGDIDAHDEEAKTEAVFERNRKYAEHLYHKLAARGFRPLLTTWGGGSFHAETLFDTDVPGPLLHAFGAWMVNDAKEFGFLEPVESFPKQAHVPADGCGNWLRVVGRHHKRDVWASVFDGTNWLEGEAAVAHVLTLTGDSPDLIPPAAHPKPEPPAEERGGTGDFKTGATGTRSEEGDDVFQEWIRTVTLRDVVGWLKDCGHWVTRETPTRVEFVREGKKESASQSFNVQVLNGCPITFAFSTNAKLPHERGLNPVQLRCYLAYGATDKAAMAKLAVVLKAELGWPETPKPVFGRSRKHDGASNCGDGAAGDSTAKQGVAIILDYFRETYRPVFRRGNAIIAASGEEVPMNVATVVPTSGLIERLKNAEDAPRYAGKNGSVGDVKRASLPGFFKTWAKVAWGDLLKTLPDEDTADLGADAPAAEEFRRLVREALLCEMTLGDVAEHTRVTQTERRSLIDWCYKFAKPGPWRTIRSKKCWCKTREGRGGELVLMIAIRHELFSQVQADKRLREMGGNRFGRLALKYGVGHSDRKDRPEGKSAVVLDEEFVNDLVHAAPEDDASGAIAA